MKKILLFCLMLFASVTSGFAGVVPLSVGYNDFYGTMPGHPKTPPHFPSISLDDCTVTFQNSHPDYTLRLINVDGDTDFETVIPAGTTSFPLPSWLSGEYEIRLQPNGSSFYFYGYVTL